MSEQQILNYLLWMKERGQSYIVPEVFTMESQSEDAELLPLPLPLPPSPAETVPVAEPVAAASKTLSISSFKVLFLSRNILLAEERLMVDRIAKALSLIDDDFVIDSGDSAAEKLRSQKSGYVVVLGSDALELAPAWPSERILEVSHPQNMLADPKLKVSTWETLQKLKAALLQEQPR